MKHLTRQQRRAEGRRAKKQGSNDVTQHIPDVDPFSLTLLNDHNVAVFREHHGVKSHEDIHRAHETRALLADAHNALQVAPFDADEYRETIDGLESAIETLDAVITPTEEALSDYFVENWVFEVIGGECRVRYQPLTQDELA